MNLEANIIERGSRVSTVMEAIRDKILIQEMHAGDMFTENALAESHGVSRGTIRSALLMLENEGLVTTLPNGRKKIVGINEDFISDLFETRIMLEQKAVETCISRNDADCSPLAVALSKFYTIQFAPKEKLPEERTVANTGFHRTLFEITGNRSLLQCWETLEPLLHAITKFGYTTVGEKSDDAKTVKIHTLILEMVMRKDTAVVDEIKRHILYAKDESIGCFHQWMKPRQLDSTKKTRKGPGNKPKLKRNS